MTPTKTLSERLDAILDRLLPKDAPRQPPPYTFAASVDGKEVLRIVTNRTTGEFAATSGATKADAIAAMEQRFPATAK